MLLVNPAGYKLETGRALQEEYMPKGLSSQGVSCSPRCALVLERSSELLPRAYQLHYAITRRDGRFEA